MYNYFIIINTVEGAFILLKNNAILAYEDKQKAIDYFEKGYSDTLALDATWQTSTVVSWMSLRPFVIEVPKDIDVFKLLQTLQNTENPDLRLFDISSSAVRRLSGVRIQLQEADKFKVHTVQLLFDNDKS